MKTDPQLFTHASQPGRVYRIRENLKAREVVAEEVDAVGGVLLDQARLTPPEGGHVFKKYELQKLPHVRKHPRK